MDIFYVGLDWGSENHAVCVMRADGSVKAERLLANGGAFVSQFLELVGGDLAAVRVAVESRELPIVDMLVAGGCAVFTLNPKQADRFRDRFGPGGAKDDRRDARVLASALRTDQVAFRQIQARSETQELLRIRVRAAADAEAQFRVAANQLRAVLLRYFPALLTMCDGADERWLWRLLAKAPDPDAAAKLTTKALQALLKSCLVRRFDAEALRKVLQSQQLRASAGVVRGCADHAQRLAERLELLRSHKVEAEKLRDQAVKALDEEQRGRSEHSDVALVASMPGAGRTVVAVLLAEATEAIHARDVAALRGLSGVAPVTKRSGKAHHVVMRRARSVFLANALFHAARVAAMNDGRFRALLASARDSKKSYGRALRGVADRWLDVLVAVLRSGVPYDPARARRSAAA